MTQRVLGEFLLLILISCQIGSIQTAPLSSYLVSSFTPPDPDSNLPFNHIAINNITGDIYIGARERLYQLDSELTLKRTVDTGKCFDGVNENDNKLLIAVLTPQNNMVIACGGCGDNCEARDPANITLNLRNFNIIDKVVATGDRPTVGVVAVGLDVNCETNENGSLYEYLYNGISGQGPSDVRFISKINLSDLSLQQYIPIHTITDFEKFTFKHVISYKDYLYYFISRKYRTYLGRLCRKTLDCRFESYTEIELQCEPNNNMIQTAHIGPGGSQLAESMNVNSDYLLYAVFSSTSSSLCVYKINDIQQRFEDAILGCIDNDVEGSGTGTENSFLQGSKCEKGAILRSDFVFSLGLGNQDLKLIKSVLYLTGCTPRFHFT
nr:plexin-B2-like [Lytechinus pictus]